MTTSSSRPNLTVTSILAAVLALIFLASGCGGDESTSASESETPTAVETGTTAPETGATAPDSDASSGSSETSEKAPPTENILMGGSEFTGAPTESPISLAFVADLAGALGSFGPSVLNGAQLMVNLANENGGIMGHPIELTAVDDQGDPANTARITRELMVTEEPRMVFGGILSSALLAQAPLARQYQTPVFATSASVATWIGEDASIFNGMTLNTSRQDSCGFAKFVSTVHPEWTRFAVLRVTFAYGAEFFEGFEECLEEFNPSAEIVAVQDYDLGTQNFLPLINAVLASDPDFIVGIIFGTDFVRFYQQYRATGSEVPIAGTLTDLEAPRAIAAEGEVPPNFVYNAAPRARYTELGASAEPWITAYEEEFGDVPSADALQGMSAFLAYKTAVEQAGTFDPTEVMRTYRCMEYYEPRGWITIRTLNGQADVPETFGAFQQVPGEADMRMDPDDSLAVTADETWLPDDAATAIMPDDAVMSPDECMQ